MKYKSTFLYGVQYYRAPTPEEDCWEKDLEHIAYLGFKHIKFWVQWRWTHRDEDIFFFDDIDKLMDLAHKNNLLVTLNVIFDVVPVWFVKKHADSFQVTSSGMKIYPQTAACRPAGGFPGPCYNHDEGKNQRDKFLTQVVNRYSKHPVMHMWDLWNEPEQCSPLRTPDSRNWVCYCENCRRGFILWLKDKYGCVENLNHVWSRCYSGFDDIELPLSTSTIIDFIDFREFHLDVMTLESNRRIRLTKELDSCHPVYVHTVPNTMKIFNSITGVDDMQISKDCDLVASTTFSGAFWAKIPLSYSGERLCYNVESHLAAGATSLHPKILGIQNIVKEFLPQLGLGIRGFMFWQYRPEILGTESPAWGLVNLNGEDTKFSLASKYFYDKLEPYIPRIMNSKKSNPEIAVWVSRKNELFHYCAYGEINSYSDSVEAYVNYLYDNNYDFTLLFEEQLEALPHESGNSSLKCLILPSPYALTGKEADAIDYFLKGGGIVISESHLGGFDLDSGKHSRTMPGLDLSEKWGLKEFETTAACHISKENINDSMEGIYSEDVKKALQASGGVGSNYFPISTKENRIVWGAKTVAFLSGKSLETIGTVEGKTCIGKSEIGKGILYFAGTNLSEGRLFDSAGFDKLVSTVLEENNISKTSAKKGIHIDVIDDNLLIIKNISGREIEVELEGYKGLFSEIEFAGNTLIEKDFVDIISNDDFL